MWFGDVDGSVISVRFKPCLSVVARSATDALHRVEVFASSLGTPATLHRVIDASIDVIVHARTSGDGALKVTEIAEPKVGGDGYLEAHSLVTFKQGEGSEGTFTTTLAPSSLAGKLKAAGQELPTSLLKPAT